MGLEIERKFLVIDESWRALVRRSQVLRQGYLSGVEGRASVRVRVQGDEARLNIKAAVVGSTRAEYDYRIPLADAQEMLERLCVGAIAKTRHWIESDDATWEVDEFSGDNEGLIVAEIELADANQRFARPPWLGAEVTDDQRYYNHYLALHPYNTWKP